MNFMTADVEIKVDDSKLTSQLAKAKGAVTKTVVKIKNSFTKMGAHFKAVFSKMVRIAKWGAVGIAAALTLVIRAAMKQEDAINRLEITLKATGHAAGFTAKQLLQQAAALQQVTRFGDESITALQTMLLTFKSIKGDEFKRATEAALDMAVAEASVSGRAVDLTATSIRLGKALNDPILGLTALSRVGVQFTETQKSMIKELVMTGDVAGAQAVMLRELEGEFGGMARDVSTASGALKQMWNALGDVAEQIGAAFLPGITESAKAVKEWAERNQEKIGQWAETAVVYITYVKDTLWTFVKFLYGDWRAGIKIGLDISIELFKGFGESIVIVMTDVASRAWRAFVKEFGEGLGTWLIEASKPKGVIGKALSVTPVGIAKRLGMMKAGAGLIERARAVEPAEGPGLGEKLKGIWRETGATIKDIVPPELAEEIGGAFSKLKTGLEEVGVVAEEIAEPMKDALVTPVKKMTRAMEEAQGKMGQWASDAGNIWGNLANIATGALDGMSDALTNLVLTGKADFNSLAQSILSDLTKMIIKAQMAQALGGIFPSLFGATGSMPLIPSGQHGGDVTKTGLAVIHKGETLSGVDKPGGKQQVTLNINVNAIDAAGTYQFLNKNKRNIATMLQSTMAANHPLRRSMK